MGKMFNTACCSGESKQRTGSIFRFLMVISYVYALVLLHFAKRELETILSVRCVFLCCVTELSCSVHRFSNASMPFMNIFRKSVVC
jgi:hypothetical protein